MSQLFMKAKETGSNILYDLWKLVFLIIPNTISGVIACKSNRCQYVFHSKKQRCAKPLLLCHETHLRNINLLLICLPGFASNNISINLSGISHPGCCLPTTRRSLQIPASLFHCLLTKLYESRSKESNSAFLKTLNSPGYLIRHPSSNFSTIKAAQNQIHIKKARSNERTWVKEPLP